MGTELDLIGQKFGRLLVESADKRTNPRGDKIVVYTCLCDCGTRKVIARSSLINGLTKSCGCLKKELAKIKHTTHNKSSTKEYSIWSSMVKRCTNKNCKGYKNYGGRGITLNPRWLKFENFFADMGKAPDKHYSLERIDVNGGYWKENCKWIPILEQSRNKRNTVWIEYEGKTLLAKDWEKITGIPRRCIQNRLKKGWSVKDTLTVKSKDGKTFKLGFEYKGEYVTYAQLERENGLSDSTINKRLKSGWSLEQAIETPPNRTRGTLITYNGETLNLREWGERIGINSNTVSKYLKKGFTMEEIINKFTN